MPRRAAESAEADQDPLHARIVVDVPRTHGPHGDKFQRSKPREIFVAEKT